jgi:hypothetical protein
LGGPNERARRGSRRALVFLRRLRPFERGRGARHRTGGARCADLIECTPRETAASCEDAVFGKRRPTSQHEVGSG